MTPHTTYLPPHLAALFAHARTDFRPLRSIAAREIERLIDFLDALDGDTDLEADQYAYEVDAEGRVYLTGISTDDENGGDDEPSLGSIGGTAAGCDYERQTRWAAGGRDDREFDDADGPEGDDEREPDVDDEPSLCGITVNAEFASGAAAVSGEAEPSLASLGGTAEGCEGSQLAWSGGNNGDHEAGAPSATHGRDRLYRDPGEALVETPQELRRRRDAKERARYGLRELRVVALPQGFRA